LFISKTHADAWEVRIIYAISKLDRLRLRVQIEAKIYYNLESTPSETFDISQTHSYVQQKNEQIGRAWCTAS